MRVRLHHEVIDTLIQYILVKAPLQVFYDKIHYKGWDPVANTVRGEAECCIYNKTSPRMLHFIIYHEYKVLLQVCWFCVGGLISLCIKV